MNLPRMIWPAPAAEARPGDVPKAPHAADPRCGMTRPVICVILVAPQSGALLSVDREAKGP